MLKKPSEDTTGTEGIGFEGGENKDRGGEGMPGILKVNVKFRYEIAWQIHSSRVPRRVFEYTTAANS